MRIPLLLLGCTLLLPARGAAQGGTPAPPAPASSIAPSHLAAARQFLDLMHIQETAAAGMTVAMDQQVQANPGLAAYRGTMEKWARDLFASEEAVNAFATMYAETFTEPELRELITFYRSPIGQRLAGRQAELARRGAEVGQRLAQAHQAELIRMLTAADSKSPQRR